MMLRLKKMKYPDARKTARISNIVKTSRLSAIIAIGLTLAGCDKCQDWRIFGTADSQLQSCKSDAVPRPQ
jgi:hypothetical protein